VATLLISGTDTGIGKTIVTSALAAYLKTFCAQQRLAIFKPIQSGPGDREHYAQQFDLTQTLEQINPLYFDAPLVQTLQKNYDWVLVEGVGGLGSPITAELTVADLAHDWHLPTILVVPVRLGALGQAIAHVALAHRTQVNVRGLILSCPEICSAQDIEQWAPVELIQSFTQRPVLGILPHLENCTDSAQLAKMTSEWDLEVLLPTLRVKHLV
jgi:dethiobiotin synthetase